MCVAYEYAMTAIPSSLQVAITKLINIDKLSESREAGKVGSMLTIFSLLFI